MTTSHAAASIVAMEVTSSTVAATAAASTITTSARREWNPTVALVLGLSLFNVDTATINLRDGIILDEVLCH